MDWPSFNFFFWENSGILTQEFADKGEEAWEQHSYAVSDKIPKSILYFSIQLPFVEAERLGPSPIEIPTELTKFMFVV